MAAGEWTSQTIESPSGAHLHTYVSIAKKPKAIIQINHGMAEHAGRYKRFASALNDAGYTTYAHDHRGHGKTTAIDSTQGMFAGKNGWNKVITDVTAVNSHIATEHSNLPIVSFGHSMGSIIAFNFALQHPAKIQGLALWNAGVETGVLAAIYRTILKTERFFKGSDVPSAIAKKLTFEAWNKAFAPNRTEFDWLSRENSEVDKYIKDPHCGFDVTIGLWLDVLNGIYFAANDSNMRNLNSNFPVHLLAGDQDPCSEKGQAVANIETRMSKRGMSNVQYELLKDTRHESLNELNRDETTERFIEWLDQNYG